MTPYEIMLSESQERMLIVAKKGREQEVLDIFRKWDLDAAVIGEVTDDGLVRLFWHGELAAAIPVDPISTEAPVYERPIAEPASRRLIARAPRARPPSATAISPAASSASSPRRISARKHWIWEQYDTTRPDEHDREAGTERRRGRPRQGHAAARSRSRPT